MFAVGVPTKDRDPVREWWRSKKVSAGNTHLRARPPPTVLQGLWQCTNHTLHQSHGSIRSRCGECHRATTGRIPTESRGQLQTPLSHRTTRLTSNPTICTSQALYLPLELLTFQLGLWRYLQDQASSLTDTVESQTSRELVNRWFYDCFIVSSWSFLLSA